MIEKFFPEFERKNVDVFDKNFCFVQIRSLHAGWNILIDSLFERNYYFKIISHTVRKIFGLSAKSFRQVWQKCILSVQSNALRLVFVSFLYVIASHTLSWKDLDFWPKKSNRLSKLPSICLEENFEVYISSYLKGSFLNTFGNCVKLFQTSSENFPDFEPKFSVRFVKTAFFESRVTFLLKKFFMIFLYFWKILALWAEIVQIFGHKFFAGRRKCIRRVWYEIIT